MPTIPDYYTYRHRSARAYTADALGVTWEARPYLYPDRLSMVAAPDIDQLILTYHTGHFPTREFDEWGDAAASLWFNALDLNRKFIKLEIIDKPLGEPVVVVRTWYGKIEVDDRDEAQKPDEAVNRTGIQRFVAFGLLRLLEETRIAKSVVETGPDPNEEEIIARGLPFNFRNRAGVGRRGNRSLLQHDDVYVFSYLPVLDIPGATADEFWNADTAVQYLIATNQPIDDAGDPICTWVVEPLVTEKLPIDWYEITVETDRRTVKDVLDELIDRRRMVGYRVFGREVDNAFEAVLKCFTFTADPISLPVGTIPANPDVQQLFAGGSNIVTDLRVSRIATQQVDEIRVEGQYITSSFSLRYGNNIVAVMELTKGWTDAQEDDYLAAAGGTAAANTIARMRDGLRDVFARFIIAAEWPETIANAAGSEQFNITCDPELFADAEVEDSDVHDLFLVGGNDPSKWSYHGKPILEYLAIKDADTNEFRRPFVLIGEGAADSPDGPWTYAEVVSGAQEGRRFNCTLHLLPDRFGSRLEVNRAGGQQLIAADHWAGAAATEEELDPTIAGNHAMHFENLILTCTLEWDDRVCVKKTIGTPSGYLKILYLFVPDAYLHFILPTTVTDIDADGQLVVSDGEVSIDDRARMRAIAESAAGWYGTIRQALQISYRELEPHVEIGTLISRLWGVSDDPINTPITGISYDFLGGTTSLETAYAEIDFAAFGGSGAKSKSGRGSQKMRNRQVRNRQA